MVASPPVREPRPQSLAITVTVEGIRSARIRGATQFCPLHTYVKGLQHLCSAHVDTVMVLRMYAVRLAKGGCKGFCRMPGTVMSLFAKGGLGYMRKVVPATDDECGTGCTEPKP